MPFRFLDNITRADVAVEATARTRGALLAQAGLALATVQVELSSVKNKMTRTFTLQATSEEQLLVRFLSELLYFKDAEHLIFSRLNSRVKTNKHKNSKDTYSATCTAGGARINNNMVLGTDVKGITMHKLRIAKKGNVWTARFVVDV